MARPTLSPPGPVRIAAWPDLFRQGWRMLLRRRESAALILLLAIAGLLSLLRRSLFTWSDLTSIARSFSWIAVAAFGESIAIIIGGVDLSVSSVMALAGLISALAMRAGIPVPLAILCGLLCGGLVGWLNGMLVGRVQMPPFIVTLAMMVIVRGVVSILTGGWPVLDLPVGFLALGQSDLPLGLVSVPMPTIIMLGVAVVLGLFMGRTVLGAHIYALAHSERALRVSGVDTVRVKVFVYTLSGIMAACGGLLMTARLGVALPTAATGYEWDVIAAAVVGGTSLFGGRGSILGVFLGAALVQMLHSSFVLLGLPTYLRPVVLGTMVLLFLLFDRWRQQRGL